MSEPHTFLDAIITDRWDGKETVYAGSLPTWAAKDPEAFGPWKKARRKALLEDRTADPKGWRVDFVITEQDEGDEPEIQHDPQTTPADPAGVTG
jgi:hypothetical protein